MIKLIKKFGGRILKPKPNFFLGVMGGRECRNLLPFNMPLLCTTCEQGLDTPMSIYAILYI